MLYTPGITITFHKEPPHVRMTIGERVITSTDVKQRLYEAGTRVLLVKKIDEIIKVNVRIGVAA